jgi:hypothetical protein
MSSAIDNAIDGDKSTIACVDRQLERQGILTSTGTEDLGQSSVKGLLDRARDSGLIDDRSAEQSE